MITEDEKRLIALLRQLPKNETEDVSDERDNDLLFIVLAAGKCDCVKDVIKLVEQNSNLDLIDVAQIIFKSGLFSALEVEDSD